MSTSNYDHLIKDSDQDFFVDRSIYTDEQIFQKEIQTIFESTWNFIAHESQISQAGDYFSTYIGHQPVFAGC